MNEEKQIAFERTTLDLCNGAREISELDAAADLVVGPAELANINIAITRLQAFILKHRRKVAA